MHKIVTSDKWNQWKSSPCCCAGCVQLEYLLDQERRQRSGLEKGRKRLEADLMSVPKSLREMEKNKTGLQELVKRSDTHASKSTTIETSPSITHWANLPHLYEFNDLLVYSFLPYTV